MINPLIADQVARDLGMNTTMLYQNIFIGIQTCNAIQSQLFGYAFIVTAVSAIVAFIIMAIIWRDKWEGTGAAAGVAVIVFVIAFIISTSYYGMIVYPGMEVAQAPQFLIIKAAFMRYGVSI